MKIYLVKNPDSIYIDHHLANLLGNHLTNNINDADIYLFNSFGLSNKQILSIQNHELVKGSVNKCIMISNDDLPLPVLRGLYTALPKLPFIPLTSWRKCFQTIFYLSSHNPFIRELKNSGIVPKYLFSFTGSETSRIRKKLFNINFIRKDILIRKTEGANFWKYFDVINGIKKTKDNNSYLQNYVREILLSKFVLCPRGNGNSSYRFFEVMEAGRVPVVLADSYVFPMIPYNWDDIVLRISEKDVYRIEEIISANEYRFAEMAELNRIVYEECFANKGEYILEAIKRLNERKKFMGRWHYKLYTLSNVYPLLFSYQFKPFVGRTIGKLLGYKSVFSKIYFNKG